MAIVSESQWEVLEQWRSTAFLVAGVIFVLDAVLLAVNLSGVAEVSLSFGQAFVGAGWTAAFIGLLGTYPDLADRSHWPPRVGAVFAAIGAVVMAAMAVTALGYSTGVLAGDVSAVAPYFLPGVFVGIVLGFGPFGVASLRTTVYSPRVGLLFLLLPVTFLFNLASGIAGFGNLTTILGVVCVLALTNLAIGYLFRTGSALADRDEADAASDPSVG